METYRVMAANTSGDLSELVTERLREGWILQGGVATYNMIFYQAMVLFNCDRIGAASERTTSEEKDENVECCYFCGLEPGKQPGKCVLEIEDPDCTYADARRKTGECVTGTP